MNSAIGSTAACAELGTHLTEILLAKTGLVNRGPIQFYDLMADKQLGHVISNLPTLASWASSYCSTTFPLTDALNALRQKKLEMVSAFSELYPD